jgi:hypothetical protein
MRGDMNKDTTECDKHPGCGDDLDQIPRCHHEHRDHPDHYRSGHANPKRVEGKVRAMSGPNTPRDILDPEFAFDLRLPGSEGGTRIFYLPLRTLGSDAMIATISAAYVKGATLIVWEMKNDPNRASRVQIVATI